MNDWHPAARSRWRIVAILVSIGSLAVFISVALLMAGGSEDASPAALEQIPPESQQFLEQVLYLHSRETIESPARMPVDLHISDEWTRIRTLAFSEIDLFNYLVGLGTSTEAATTAAAGWDAGEVSVYYSDSAQTLVRVSLEWNSQEDQGDAQLAFDNAFRSYAEQGFLLNPGNDRCGAGPVLSTGAPRCGRGPIGAPRSFLGRMMWQ